MALMDGDEINALAAAFVERHSKVLIWDKDMVLRKVDKSGTDWANHKICDVTYERPADLWPFILETLRRTEDPDVLGVLAAGPLEDYLAKLGEYVIAEVESQAAADEKFKHLLGGVWRNSMSHDVWERVCRCRGEPW
jgi:hypothetical protein